MIELVIHAIVYKATTTDVTGSFVKEEVCDHCGQQFHYVLTRRVTVSRYRPTVSKGVRQKLTQRDADALVRQSYWNSNDPVPCPHCGWFQTPMIPGVRGILARAYHPYLQQLAIVLLSTGALGFCFSLAAIGEGVERNEPLWIAVGIVSIVCCITIGAVGLALARRRNRALKNYDPNDDGMIPERIAYGQQRHQEANEFLLRQESATLNSN